MSPIKQNWFRIGKMNCTYIVSLANSRPLSWNYRSFIPLILAEYIILNLKNSWIPKLNLKPMARFLAWQRTSRRSCNSHNLAHFALGSRDFQNSGSSWTPYNAIQSFTFSKRHIRYWCFRRFKTIKWITLASHSVQILELAPVELSTHLVFDLWGTLVAFPRFSSLLFLLCLSLVTLSWWTFLVGF
jgi:hypothetical protein